MSKFRLLYFFLAVTCLVSFTSCGDDDEDDVSPNVSLLTAGDWTGSAVFAGGDDITDQFEAETGLEWSDYVTVFERDGTYAEIYAGNTVVEGTWEFANNERVIVFDSGTANEYQVVVSQLDEDEFFYIQDGLELRFTR